MLFLDSARRHKAAALRVCAKSGVSRREARLLRLRYTGMNDWNYSTKAATIMLCLCEWFVENVT